MLSDGSFPNGLWEIAVTPAPLLSFAVMLTVPLVGGVTLLLARLSQGSGLQATAQRIFLLAILAVAAATMTSAWLGAGDWPVLGGTLGLMVVGATFDGGRRSAAELF